MTETPERVSTATQTVPADRQAALATSMAALSGELVQDLQLNLEGTAVQQVEQAMRELDVTDSNSIIFFGSKAQQQLTEVSDSMLESVRTKDVGPAGDALNSMVAKLRELKFEAIDPRDKPGFLARLFGAKNKLMQYLDEYETVRDQIDGITNDLERHKTTLLTDITKLDKLYDVNLDYFRSLEVYIAAGRAKLKELDETVIPAMAKEVENSDDVIEAQKLR
ncbi:MAG: toxic anion resistance protein, partial [Geminicoccaceae bacterium]|nr:toxic anion resistance protein [Geminicoccaceae bacterium]